MAGTVSCRPHILDLDLFVGWGRIADLAEPTANAGMHAEEFEHCVDLSVAGAYQRVQVQKDPRYQEFISRAEIRNVLGYEMAVACLDDVLAGELWAASDDRRAGSKRQKDLADIMRPVDTHPRLGASLISCHRLLL